MEALAYIEEKYRIIEKYDGFAVFKDNELGVVLGVKIDNYFRGLQTLLPSIEDEVKNNKDLSLTMQKKYLDNINIIKEELKKDQSLDGNKGQVFMAICHLSQGGLGRVSSFLLSSFMSFDIFNR